MQLTETHSLYVVRFDDGRIKFGISANVPKRMTYYRQEARRNGITGLVWWAAAPVEKKSALRAERILGLIHRHKAIKHHREWLTPAARFDRVVRLATCIRQRQSDEAARAHLEERESCGQFQGLQC